jgi:branched-chain amino acid transport system permease protein
MTGRARRVWVAPSVLLLAAAAAPLALADYQLIFAAEILIWGLFALSFGLVYGFGGMLSFAQALYFGAGCYGFNLATYKYALGTWGAIGMGVFAAVAFALPTGYIATRVRQHHFLIVTVILSVLTSAVLASGHWRWMAGPYVTRSLPFVPTVPLGPWEFSFASEIFAFYFTVALVAVAVWLAWRLTSSPFGTALRAIRDNEHRAALVGLNVNLLRWLMFTFAGGIAGLAGTLYVLLARYTNLEFFEWTYSGKAAVAAILGGAQSLAGPFAGMAFYLVTAEYLSRYFQQFTILFGILLLIVLRFAPEGLYVAAARLARDAYARIGAQRPVAGGEGQ